MANPIKTSDLYQDTGELKKLIVELEEVQSKLEELRKNDIKNAAKLETRIKKLTATTSTQRDEIEKSAKEAEKIAKSYNKYSDSLEGNAKKLVELKAATQEQNRINKAQVKLANSTAGSYNALSAQYTLNKIALNKLSAEERENNAEAKKLEDQTNAIFEEMKRLQAATGKTALNVGNYKDSLKGAISETVGLDRVMGVLSKNPIVLVLGLIVGTLGALFSAFKKSEKGVQLMTRATGFFNGLMSQLVDLSVKVADFLTGAFEDPQQAATDFGQLLIDQVINRFKAIIDIGGAAGRAIKAIFSGSLEDLKNAATDAGTALVQLTTGLDEQTQIDFANAVKETAKEIENETNAFIKLEVAKRNVANANRKLATSIEGLITKEEILNGIAGDATLSFKEQEDAAEKARAAIEARAGLEIKLAKNNLSLINQEIGLRRSNGEAVDALLDSQLDAYRQVIAAERDLTLSVRDNEQERRQLKQDRLEKDLDILIDGFDNQKTINERLLQDDTLTLEARAKLFNETAKLADESFQKQIETVQKFTGIQVDENDLISESNAVLLNEKIRGLGLSEIIEGRLLEIIRDRRTATLDLAEVEKELLEERKKAFGNFDPIALPLNNESVDGVIKEGKKVIAKMKKDFADSVPDGDDSEGKDLFDLLGFSFDDDQKEGITSALSFVKDQLLQLANLRKQVADEAVNQSNVEVAAAQRTLQAEIENRNAGFANNTEQAEKELNLAKSTQQKALKEQEKARKQQEAIASIQQGVNLITAASKIFAQIGNPVISIPLIALMFGTFAATKIKAASLTKKKFAKGGYEVLGGGSHASGNDTDLGFNVGNKRAFGERGEGVAVFSRVNTEKYQSVLPDIIGAINRGTFEKEFQRRNSVEEIPLLTVMQNQSFSDKKIVETLKELIKQGNKRSYLNEKGQLVEVDGNITRTYV